MIATRSPFPGAAGAVVVAAAVVVVFATWASVAAAPLAAQKPAKTKTERTAEFDAESVRREWSALSPDARRDVVERFAEDVRHLDGLRAALVAHVLQTADLDAGFVPDAGEIPHYDPKVHAPAQPIPRKRLEPDSTAAREFSERTFQRAPKTGLDAAFRYDWARREVVRVADPLAPERVFENGLAGYAPGHDFALALVERALDRGDQAKALAALGHAYTDRAGAVYPGVTLYDAWASGVEIEMPDVDVLGVIHDVFDDWQTWKAPIPERQHASIYAEVKQLFLDARDYRGLRSALAWTYLSGSAPLADGYVGHRLRLHGLWESVSSEPAALAPKLPDAAKREEFLYEWSQSFDKNAELLPRAQARQAALERDATRVRDTLAAVVAAVAATATKQETRRPSKPANSGG
ncbi:MAG: hypothetical protein L6Q99_07395 [Planctomycetes bacterium]|nr:hypothetical protein [Planctomycetota bacterium]